VSTAASTRPPILVLVLAGAFLLLVISLLIGSFTKPEFPPYQLGPSPDAPGVYTLDASRDDSWERFHFATNRVVDSGGDIAFRRHHVITAPGAAARDLGPVSFDSLTDVPTAEYAATAVGADTVNPEIGRWYSYSMLSHLLTSKHHVYAVRSADGDFYAFEILAYYCRDVGAACYTMRYKKARPRI
jgi:hypothetical protein